GGHGNPPEPGRGSVRSRPARERGFRREPRRIRRGRRAGRRDARRRRARPPRSGPWPAHGGHRSGTRAAARARVERSRPRADRGDRGDRGAPGFRSDPAARAPARQLPGAGSRGGPRGPLRDPLRSSRGQPVTRAGAALATLLAALAGAACARAPKVAATPVANGAASSKFEGDFQARLRAATGSQSFTALVDLTERVDLPALSARLRAEGRDKRSRRAAVVAALERAAEGQQAELRPLLDRMLGARRLERVDSL